MTSTDLTSFDDLDSLISEGLELTAAKRAASQGRKLTLDQQELLAANAQSEAMELWAPQEVFAHVVKVTCECGNHFEEFKGWFVFEVQKRGKGSRLVRQDDHMGLDASKYITVEEVSWCAKCATTDLPEATVEDCHLLDSLGLPECDEEGQLGLSLTHRLEEAEDDLQELQAELDEELSQ